MFAPNQILPSESKYIKFNVKVKMSGASRCLHADIPERKRFDMQTRCRYALTFKLSYPTLAFCFHVKPFLIENRYRKSLIRKHAYCNGVVAFDPSNFSFKLA